jgi:hypothetical protein
MFKLLYLITLIIIILFIIIYKKNINTNIELLTVSSSKLNGENTSQSNNLCCKEESSIAVLLNNLNDKYDKVIGEYKTLQENITTNTERIDYIHSEYESKNSKLQAEFNSS